MKRTETKTTTARSAKRSAPKTNGQTRKRSTSTTRKRKTAVTEPEVIATEAVVVAEAEPVISLPEPLPTPEGAVPTETVPEPISQIEPEVEPLPEISKQHETPAVENTETPKVLTLPEPVQTLDERAEAMRDILNPDTIQPSPAESDLPPLPENARERLIRYLNEAWSTEQGLVDTLQSMSADMDSNDLERVLQDHRVVTDRQRVDLAEQLRQLGAEPSTGRGLFSQIMNWLNTVLRSKPKDEGDRMLQNVLRSYAIEHLEIAMYEALYVCAQLLKENGIAEMAARHLQEERDAADQLRPFIRLAAARAMSVPES